MNNKKTILLKESELINFLATTTIDVKKYLSEQAPQCTRFCPSHDIKEVVNKNTADPILSAAQEVIRLMEVYDKAISDERFEEFVGHKPPSSLTTGKDGNIMKPLADQLWNKTDNMSGPEVEEFVEALKNNEDATQLLEYLNISPHLTKNLPKDVVYPSDAHKFANEWKEDNVLWSVTSDFPDDIIDVYKSRTKEGTLDSKYDNAEHQLEDQRFEHMAAQGEEDAKKAKDAFYMEAFLELPFELPNPLKELLRHLWEMGQDWAVTIQEAATWLWDNIKKVWKWFTEDGYHIVLDIISFLAFISCGTLLPGLGCVISIVADVVNAALYIYDKEDYYMAGMQLSFAMVPAGELAKPLFKPLKYLLEPLFKKIFQILLKGKALTKTALQVELKALGQAIRKEAGLFKELLPKSVIKTLTKWFNKVDDFMMDLSLKAYIPFIGEGVDKLMRTTWNIAGGFIRALIWIGEAIWYDPEYTATLIGGLGKWSGIETFESWADVMKDWPKTGVKVAHYLYDKSGIGGIEALVQTKIADCNNTVYTWEHAKQEYMAERDIEEGDFDREELEKDWWNGWRPRPQIEGGRSGPRELPLTSDTKAMEAYAKKQSQMTAYVAMKACDNFEFQRQYGIDKMSCAQFIEYWDGLEDKKVWVNFSEEGEDLPDVLMAALTALMLNFADKCPITTPTEDEEEDFIIELPD